MIRAVLRGLVLPHMARAYRLGFQAGRVSALSDVADHVDADMLRAGDGPTRRWLVLADVARGVRGSLRLEAAALRFARGQWLRRGGGSCPTR